jgi:hypothetical protein
MTANTLIKNDSIIFLTEDGIKAVETLRKAREMAELAKSLENDAKAVLNGELPEGAVGVNTQGLILITRDSAKTSSIDRKTLEALYPEAYKATYKETRYTKLILPKA